MTHQSEAKSFTVSEKTQRMYGCLLSMRSHFDQTHEAIEFAFGKMSVDYYAKEYVEHYNSVLEALEKLLVLSINENMYGDKPNTL